jgi:hypothetical protein
MLRRTSWVVLGGVTPALFLFGIQGSRATASEAGSADSGRVGVKPGIGGGRVVEIAG